MLSCLHQDKTVPWRGLGRDERDSGRIRALAFYPSFSELRFRGVCAPQGPGCRWLRRSLNSWKAAAGEEILRPG